MHSVLARQLRRPFPNAHWSLLAALVLVWEFSLWSQPCKEPPHYLESVIAACTVCLAFWVSHLRVAPVSSVRAFVAVVGGALYDLALLVLVLFIAAIPIVVIMPTYQCYTPKAKVTELFQSVGPLHDAIASRITQKKSTAGVGSGLQVEVKGRVQGGIVTDDGLIVVVGEDPAAVVLLQPKFNEGQVSWQCIGFPAKYMPYSCR